MPESVSREIRLKNAEPYRIDYSLISKDTFEPYRYIRLAKKAGSTPEP